MKVFNYDEVEAMAKEQVNGRLFRIGAFSEKKLCKDMKGFTLVKFFELTGRIGCKYPNVVKDYVPSEKTVDKVPNYEMIVPKKIKRFFNTNTKQLMFYPMPKHCNAKSSYFIVNPNGEYTELTANDFANYGGTVGNHPIVMNINAEQIYQFGKVKA